MYLIANKAVIKEIAILCRNIITDSEQLSSKGKCIRAAELLSWVAAALEIDYFFIEGFYVDEDGKSQHHCWSEIEQFFVDITADQFDHKPILIRKTKPKEYKI